MIYVTGDTHGDFHKFTSRNFPEQVEMTKDDYVIICGDFGGVWNKGTESDHEAHWLDWLNDRSFTTLFVDGNHENYDRLLCYPEIEFNGGKVNRIRPSVLHLQRGQVYTLCGKKCFTFGGARSHDIDGGILEPDDPARSYKEFYAYLEGKHCRTNHVTWWAEEEPSQEEMDLGMKTLEENNWHVDFVLTHDCPTSILCQMYSVPESYQLTNYLEQINQKLKYKWWFFGHHHMDCVFGNTACLFYQITRIC